MLHFALNFYGFKQMSADTTTDLNIELNINSDTDANTNADINASDIIQASDSENKQAQDHQKTDHQYDPERPQVRFENVTEHQQGQRLDNFLMAQFRSVPKSKIYQIIRKGEVRVNKGRAKPETKLNMGDIVRIPPVYMAEKDEAQAPKYWQERLLANIIFEDKDVLVINKPSGLAVHRGSGLDTGVIECLRAARPDLPFMELVHRLDRETSGCLIIAKNGQILRQIQSAEMDKRYLCLVMGRWRKSVFDEKSPLDVENREMGERHVVVSEKGKPAHTRFTPRDDFLGASLIEARLFTGRTHQIRVHALHCGHPIAGDERYGDLAFNKEMKVNGLNRTFLHAHSLMLDVAGKSYAFSAPLPDELNAVLERLVDNKENRKLGRTQAPTKSGSSRPTGNTRSASFAAKPRSGGGNQTSKDGAKKKDYRKTKPR